MFGNSRGMLGSGCPVKDHCSNSGRLTSRPGGREKVPFGIPTIGIPPIHNGSAVVAHGLARQVLTDNKDSVEGDPLAFLVSGH
jgi:hypothetical protein